MKEEDKRKGKLMGMTWHRVIFDEAHVLKNKGSQ
jgi:SNF2 family DNA or RNA helicase